MKKILTLSIALAIITTFGFTSTAEARTTFRKTQNINREALRKMTPQQRSEFLRNQRRQDRELRSSSRRAPQNPRGQ